MEERRKTYTLLDAIWRGATPISNNEDISAQERFKTEKRQLIGEGRQNFHTWDAYGRKSQEIFWMISKIKSQTCGQLLYGTNFSSSLSGQFRTQWRLRCEKILNKVRSVPRYKCKIHKGLVSVLTTSTGTSQPRKCF